jgi:hypothetical protein
MNPEDNPYTPNPGAMPEALIGRDKLLRDFDHLLSRVARGLTDKGMLITGFRGVGKTVVLNKFKELARSRDAVVIFQEIPKSGVNFPYLFATQCRQALFAISPREKWKTRAMNAARTITSFSTAFSPDGTMRVSLGVAPAEGQADTGSILLDLPDVIVALGEAAQEHGKTIVILLDEIQYLSAVELNALVMAKHQINQNSLPVVLCGAGLPQLPALTDEAQSYAERMFKFPEIGTLDTPLAELAITKPADNQGVIIAPDAVSFIVDYTEGYPYFIQEYGFAIWNRAENSPITLEDAEQVKSVVDSTLDQDFFSVRTDSLADNEKAYVKALAGLGSGEHSQADVARALRVKDSSKTGTVTNRLVERGIIFRTRRGQVQFTVPQFHHYVERTF